MFWFGGGDDNDDKHDTVADPSVSLVVRILLGCATGSNCHHKDSRRSVRDLSVGSRN
jgi:hypothetical protein